MNNRFSRRAVLAGLGGLTLFSPASVTEETRAFRIAMVMGSATCSEFASRQSLDVTDVSGAYYQFLAEGAEIALFTTDGAPAKFAEWSIRPDLASGKRFQSDDVAQVAFRNAQPLEQLHPTEVDAVFFAGGCAALQAFLDDDRLPLIAGEVAALGGCVSSIDAGLGAFVRTNLRGRPLVFGRTVTGPSLDLEENTPEGEAIVRLVATARLLGAHYAYTSSGAPFVVATGNLVTAQNAAAGEAVAHAVMRRLRGLPPPPSGGQVEGVSNGTLRPWWSSK